MLSIDIFNGNFPKPAERPSQQVQPPLAPALQILASLPPIDAGGQIDVRLSPNSVGVQESESDGDEKSDIKDEKNDISENDALAQLRQQLVQQLASPKMGVDTFGGIPQEVEIDDDIDCRGELSAAVNYVEENRDRLESQQRYHIVTSGPEVRPMATILLEAASKPEA